jgi:hypothetical protein
MKKPSLGPAAIKRVDFWEKQLLGFHVQAQHEGHRIQRFFSDAQYGGKRPALRAARAFAAQLGKGSEFQALLRRLKPRRNSRSGTPGVARYQPAKDRGAYWFAYWDENGRKVCRRFAVSLYGEERASELAHRARQRAVKMYVKRLAELRRQDHRLLRSPKSGQSAQGRHR